MQVVPPTKSLSHGRTVFHQPTVINQNPFMPMSTANSLVVDQTTPVASAIGPSQNRFGEDCYKNRITVNEPDDVIQRDDMSPTINAGVVHEPVVCKQVKQPMIQSSQLLTSSIDLSGAPKIEFWSPYANNGNNNSVNNASTKILVDPKYLEQLYQRVNNVLTLKTG